MFPRRSMSAPPGEHRMAYDQTNLCAIRLFDRDILRARNQFSKSLKTLKAPVESNFAVHEWCGYWEYVTTQLDALEVPTTHHVTLQACLTCRSYKTFPLYQYVTEMDLVGGSADTLDVKFIRIYHVSRDDKYPGSEGNSRLELAILDFLCPKQITDDSRTYISHLGYNFEVRMGDPAEGEEEQVWLVRAMIDFAEMPWKRLDFPQIMKEMTMYSGPYFDQFKSVGCPQTIMMFLKMTNLEKRGYRLLRVSRPDITRGYMGTFLSNPIIPRSNEELSETNAVASDCSE